MLNFVDLIQNPTNLISVAAVLIVLATIVFATLLVGQRRSIKQLRAMSDSLSHLHESFVRTNLNLESVANKLQILEAQSAELLENYQHSKEEVVRMAETMGGESQLTKAIDLARAGAGAKEITISTGLAEDEATAIVKFHGSSKR